MMVGLTGNYFFVFLWHVDMQQATVLVVPGDFRSPTQIEGATKEVRNWVKMPKVPRLGPVIIAWT